MNVRMLIAVLALAIVPATYAADEENPYKKAKVGDSATYKMVTKVAGAEIEGTITQTVTAKTDKAVTLKSSGKMMTMGMELPVPAKETIIDITKPYDPTRAIGLPGAPGTETKVELLKEGQEKLKVAGKEYAAKWSTYKVKTKTGGMEIDAEVKVWLAAELPIPILKTEMKAEGMGNKMEMTMEMTEPAKKDK